MPSKDFSFLQDPAAYATAAPILHIDTDSHSYHILPTAAIPAPFLNAPTLPSASSPIDTLLISGHYRLAANSAARNIVGAASPHDHSTLLHLLHIRLACLCLINEHALAAQESKVLGDTNSAFYRHPLTNAHLVPWDLRLLVVRLAAIGYGEWRKGIMGYYELARECRENIVRASTTSTDKTLWRTRLRDCGVRVANVLVEMGDLDGAGRHLATLTEDQDAAGRRDITLMETLIWLRVGDIASARRCLARLDSASENSPIIDSTLAALIQLADSDFEAAATSFRALYDAHPDDAMVAQNLAVCLVYTGRIADAKDILSTLVDQHPPFHSMVFNLSTVYELCTERNRDKKVALAAKLATRKDGGGVGWEMNATDFKLQPVA
jgi:tetratricopeptide (TPR) repeat protein